MVGIILFLGALIGVCLFLDPASAIEFQRKFYVRINWRIEPISMPKEIRNTRLMGLFLIFASLLTGSILCLNARR